MITPIDRPLAKPSGVAEASPIYQVMPPLSAEEYETLKAEIAERGVLVPLVTDQHGNLLDGHNRKEIADELGVPYRTDVVTVASEEEAWSLARMYNLARRHLSREQKRTLIADEIENNPARSDRAIARVIGCDHKTVGAVRRELRGEIPQSDPSTADEERARQLTEQIKASIRSTNQELLSAVSAGMSPACVAQILRQVRDQFLIEVDDLSTAELIDAVDELLFPQGAL